MTILEWLLLILVYLAAYGLWSAFEAYRERAPYRSKKSRRITKVVVLTLVLIGFGAAYNSVPVRTLFQTERAESEPTSDLIKPSENVEEPTPDESGATEGSEAQPALGSTSGSTSGLTAEEASVEVKSQLIATLPSRKVREVGLEGLPPLTTVPSMSAPSVAAPSTSTPIAPSTAVSQPAASTPPTPQPFKVSFQSDPPGAALYLGGERVGVTPTELSLAEDEPLPYTLRAEEGVPNYRLYHPFSDTLTLTRDTSLSVWLERLNREEVAALRGKGEAFSVTTPHAQHVSADTTRYRVATDCAEGLDLTYTDKQQRVVQERGRKAGWAYGFIPKPGQFLYLYARNNCASGSLEVQLVQGDEVLLENTASGKDSIATVSTFW